MLCNGFIFQVHYKFLYECLNEVSTLGPTYVPAHKVNAFLKSPKFMKRTQQEYEVKLKLNLLRPDLSDLFDMFICSTFI